MKRRDFMKLGSLTATAIILDACGIKEYTKPQPDNTFNVFINPQGSYDVWQSKNLVATSIPIVVPNQAAFQTNIDENCHCEETQLIKESEYQNSIADEVVYRNSPDKLLPLVEYVKYNNKGLIVDGGIYDSFKGDKASANLSTGGKVNGYYYRVSSETHYVGGCIKATTPHIGFMLSLQGSSNPIVDIHLCAWKKSGKVCLGIYDSGKSKRCYNVCPKDVWISIRDYVYIILLSAGITASVAWVIATIAATASAAPLIALI